MYLNLYCELITKIMKSTELSYIWLMKKKQALGRALYKSMVPKDIPQRTV